MITADASLLVVNSSERSVVSVCAEYETYKTSSYIVAGLCIPLLVLLGCVANVCCILIFCSRQMRGCLINWYLIGLSCSDLVLVVCSFFIFSLPVMDFFQQPSLVVTSNYFMRCLYPVALISQTASVWMTVVVTAHRYLGVCFPLHAQRLCTEFKTKVCIGMVTGLSVLYNVTRFLETELRSCWSSHFKRLIVSLYPTALRMNESYHTHYLGWSYTTVMFIVPFLTLIFTTARTISEVQRSGQLRQVLAGASIKQQQRLRETTSPNIGKFRSTGSRFSISGPSNKEHGTTIMLVGIVISFLVCNALAFVNNILETVLRRKQQNSSENYEFIATVESVFPYLIECSNFLVLINSTINILIYYGFSRKFRQAFSDILKRTATMLDSSYAFQSLSSTVPYPTKQTTTELQISAPSPTPSSAQRKSVTSSLSQRSLASPFLQKRPSSAYSWTRNSRLLSVGEVSNFAADNKQQQNGLTMPLPAAEPGGNSTSNEDLPNFQ